MVIGRNVREEPSLQACTLGIKVCGNLAGTGFFISKNGHILTCFHVVGDCRTAHLNVEEIRVQFGQEEYPVSHIFSSPQPEILDYVVLQIAGRGLPRGSALLPLGIADKKTAHHEFVSYGFRAAHLEDGGAFAEGHIVNSREYCGTQILQLRSESAHNQQMRAGMSGAPIYDRNTREIIGMYVEYAAEGTQEIIPLAISLENIANQWETLQEVLDEQGLWRQLAESNILQIDGPWLTERAFETLYSGFPGLIPYHRLGGDREQELLDQLQAQGKIIEFLNYLKACQPSIPIERSIRKKRGVRFLNREDEKQKACESLAPPFIFFEGPMGYGKTRFLAEVRKEHFRKRWLCIQLDASEDCNNLEGLIRQMREQVSLGQDTIDIEAAPVVLAARLGGRIIDRIESMHGIGLLITLDHAEKLPTQVIQPFIRDFLVNLSKELRNAGTGEPFDLRLRVAGRHGGAKWVETAAPVIIKLMMLSPFHFKYIEEAVKFSLPDQKNAGLYAAYLMHVSGGHPHCIAEGIKRLGVTDGDIDQHFAHFEDRTRELIHCAADEIRQSMRRDLDGFALLAEKLCVFPILDRDLLHLLILHHYLDTNLDQYDLEEMLLRSNYYYRDDGNCLYDHIARRVLLIEYRISDFEGHQRECRSALEFYYQSLQEYERHIEKMFLAILELELILSATVEQKISKDDFFGAGGILARCRDLLEQKEKGTRKDILADLSLLLKNPERTGEFRLLFDFLLRAEQDGARLYEEFVDIIDGWKQEFVQKIGRE
jgi:hypothetical protein